MMKKITFLLFVLIASLGYTQTSNYCSTEVFHLNIPAETASAFNLTIVNTGANTMKVTAANADISFLDLVGSITGAPTKSAADNSVPGEISITLTWAPAAPTNVTFQFIQWRKSGPATWQINDATTPSAGVCTVTPPAEDATLSNLTVNGTTVSGFSASTLTYNIELPYGTIAVPTVVGTPTQAAPAAAVTTDAGSLPGTSTVEVTSQDGNVTQTYTLNFTVAATPPVGLPLDFSDASHLFTFDPSGGDPGTVSIINEELSAPTNGKDWDNVYITFTEQVDLTNDAANTITFKIKSTTALAGVEHFHRTKISGPSGAHELDFSTIGQEEKTVVLDYPTLGNNYTEFRIFLDAGYGATASAVETYLIDDISAPMATPATCSDGIMNQDETGIDCGGICGNVCDVTAPTSFTATAGTLGSFSVELLLNATDDFAGAITYDISYNAGVNTAQTTGASGVEKAFTVSGLTAETTYSFDVTAKDAAGNVNGTTITVPATTLADSSNECAGFSNAALEGSWSQGFNYTFVTSGTDVTVSFEVLDTDKPGLNPEIFVEPSTFLPMDQSAAPTYTYTFTGQTDGTDLMFSLRAAYAGGLVRSNIFTYTVGEDCSSLGTEDFVKTSFSVYPNPSTNSWTVKTKNVNMSSIQVFDVLGKNIMSLAPNASEASIDASNLKSGLYFAQIKTKSGISSLKLIKK